jgi:hypothetical protein
MFYDIFHSRTQSIDFHRATLSRIFELVLRDPSHTPQGLHCHANLGLSQARGHLDIPRRAIFYVFEVCYQPGHIPIDAQALQARDEIQVLFVGDIDSSFSNDESSNVLYK